MEGIPTWADITDLRERARGRLWLRHRQERQLVLACCPASRPADLVAGSRAGNGGRIFSAFAASNVCCEATEYRKAEYLGIECKFLHAFTFVAPLDACADSPLLHLLRGPLEHVAVQDPHCDIRVRGAEGQRSSCTSPNFLSDSQSRGITHTIRPLAHHHNHNHNHTYPNHSAPGTPNRLGDLVARYA